MPIKPITLIKFRVGDVVCLNFGVLGPDMTVAANTTNGVKCIWFDDNDILHDGVFPVDVLQLEIDREESLSGEEEEEEEE
jgi:uncharacterized protein YodC (DUF2158 family)